MRTISKKMDNLQKFLHSLNPIAYFRRKNIKILMLGLDGSGKTTLLYKLLLNKIVNTVPTIGFNLETVHHNNTDFTFWDLGGSYLLRQLYRHYYAQTQGLIFVLDGTNRERISEAKFELETILDGIRTECPKDFYKIPILIWNNKQDLAGQDAMTDEQVGEEFQSIFYQNFDIILQNRKTGLKWTVGSVSAINGNGLYEGLDWLDRHQDPDLWKREFFKKLSFIVWSGLQIVPNLTYKTVTLPKSIYRGLMIKYFQNKLKIVMLGLDGPGKTSILYKLKTKETIRTIPTIGFNVEAIEYKNTELTLWDVGGGDKIRPLWRHYAENMAGVIFVVDSTDVERMEEAGWELLRILEEDSFANAIFLVFANKQDVQGALGVDQIVDKLGLNSSRQSVVEDEMCKRWHVQPCSAFTGEGLYEGLDWLVKQRKYFSNEKQNLV